MCTILGARTFWGLERVPKKSVPRAKRISAAKAAKQNRTLAARLKAVP
jgi:hypothetical protein